MPAVCAPDLAQLDLFCEAATQALRAHEWLQNLCLRRTLLTAEQRRELNLHRSFLAPLLQVQEKLRGNPGALALLRLMTATRLRLERLNVSLGTVPAASAYELAVQASWFVVRIWNQVAHPDQPDNRPNPLAEDWDILIHLPHAGLNRHSFDSFLAIVAVAVYESFNPRSLDADLKLEKVHAAALIRTERAALSRESLVATGQSPAVETEPEPAFESLRSEIALL
jgi:hypothetical protein